MTIVNKQYEPIPSEIYYYFSLPYHSDKRLSA